MTILEIDDRLSEIEQQKTSIRSMLEILPKDHLYCEQSGKYVKWFRKDRTSGDKIYIKKHQKAYAVQLAKSKYYSALLSDMQKEEKALHKLRKELSFTRKSDRLLSNTNYRNLLFPEDDPITCGAFAAAEKSLFREQNEKGTDINY